MIAGAGDDTMFANDGETDVQIHGAAGIDTATVDANLDPATIAVENKIIDSGPPPPPPPPGGACTYNAATKSVTAAIPVGGTATLAVVGGAIHFGANPTACGAATTTNTDSIAVNGAAGSVEALTVDQTGGALAPGVGAESNGIAEIELAINLGDATDQIVFKGTAGADALAIGTKGVSYNSDTDVDATIAPMPNAIELAGGEGDDILTARGGYGAGQVFLGSVVLRGEGGADTLTGSNLDDLIVGAGGNDVITGYSGNDELRGDEGNDQLNGNDGNDLMIGGSGADSLVGGNGNDTLQAADGVADTSLSGGAGADTAFFDVALDPTPSAVEIQNP
jgi:Ca2+-binding RTX toxin-like protein